MLTVGIYNADEGASIPNLALMKLAAYHKERGDAVEEYLPLNAGRYDKVFASNVFSFSEGRALLDPAQMEIGGSAWDLKKELPTEVERCTPDYSFYGYPHSLGFTMRGCRFRCKFCVVPEKEGRPNETASPPQNGSTSRRCSWPCQSFCSSGTIQRLPPRPLERRGQRVGLLIFICHSLPQCPRPRRHAPESSPLPVPFPG